MTSHADTEFKMRGSSGRVAHLAVLVGPRLVEGVLGVRQVCQRVLVGRQAGGSLRTNPLEPILERDIPVPAGWMLIQTRGGGGGGGGGDSTLVER